MIEYSDFTLSNGLKVIVHEDHSVPIAVLNLLYDVGSRDEDPNKTGFAHLFEHLMFGGSKNVPHFDKVLQNVGADNNAFTSPDVTNYYISVPSDNLETAFWVESDRMLNLNVSSEPLEVQRKVVIEEFKQRYLSQPYGDVWLKMRPLAYKTHPYRWATIGKEISHIENATLEDVQAFFNKFYRPNNAVLVIAGNVTLDQVKQLTTKWFEPIPAGETLTRNLPQESAQTEARLLEVEADVPQNALYKAWHMADKLSPKYQSADLLSDIAGRGRSSRIYRKLVREEKLFTTATAYISGSFDAGLVYFNGKLAPDVSFETADKAVTELLSEFQSEIVSDEELNKVKSQVESSNVFSEVELLNRAINLAYAGVQGNPNLVNEEWLKYQAVTAKDIQDRAKEILNPENCSTIYYKSKA